jgi:hypothetical protein
MGLASGLEREIVVRCLELSLKFRLRIYMCNLLVGLIQSLQVELSSRQHLDTPFKLLMGLLSSHGPKGSCDNPRRAELQIGA